MQNGFDFELNGSLLQDCFMECSSYKNGNLRLSMYGLDTNEKQISCIDISLDQDVKQLQENQIIVDNYCNLTLIPQLEKLGILKEQVGMCVVKDYLYPIYSIDFSKIAEMCCELQELVAA